MVLVGRRTPRAHWLPSKTRIIVSPVNRMLTSILCLRWPLVMSATVCQRTTSGCLSLDTVKNGEGPLRFDADAHTDFGLRGR